MERAFFRIKKLFKVPLSLYTPDPDRPFIVYTDVCKTGIGAVLYQQGPGGKRRIVSYASAKIFPVEWRYHSNEQESLTILWAFREYRPLLEDRTFILSTDNVALALLDRFSDENWKLAR